MAHWVQHTLCYAWLYTPTSQRGPIQAISHCEASRPIVLSYSAGNGDEVTRAIAGAQAEVTRACVPVCPTPLVYGHSYGIVLPIHI